MATHSSSFAWKIPWTIETGGLQSWGLQKSRTTLRDWAQASQNCFVNCETLQTNRMFCPCYQIVVKQMGVGTQEWLFPYSKL